MDGKLVEVVLDFFAQDDNGTVYYLGEDVDEYENGKIIGHDGTWHYGLDTRVPGVMFPAQPKLGQKWRSEDVSSEISEIDDDLTVRRTQSVGERRCGDEVQFAREANDRPVVMLLDDKRQLWRGLGHCSHLLRATGSVLLS